MVRPLPGCLLLVLLLSSCSRRDAGEAPLVQEEQQPYHPAWNVLNVTDPGAAPRLLKGWHEAEPGGWRWTEKNFAVLMKTPARGQAAILELNLVVPEASIARLHSITLRALIGRISLPAETYSQPGGHTYSQLAPGAAMQGDTVRIEFQLDKALAPGEVDSRELGVVVSSVSLD